MDKLSSDVEYGVLDDVDINFFPAYKQWVGGQREFECTDKYKGKRTFDWHKPVIWTVNEINDPREGKNVDRTWLEQNMIFVRINKPLFERDDEDELSDWEIEAGLIR